MLNGLQYYKCKILGIGAKLLQSNDYNYGKAIIPT